MNLKFDLLTFQKEKFKTEGSCLVKHHRVNAYDCGGIYRGEDNRTERLQED